MWTFQTRINHLPWQTSSKQFKFLKEACADAADWLEVSAVNGCYGEQCEVRIVAVPK